MTTNQLIERLEYVKKYLAIVIEKSELKQIVWWTLLSVKTFLEKAKLLHSHTHENVF